MISFFKKRVFPIGVDLGSGYLKMAQLGFNGKELYLHAAGCEARPDDIEFGSSSWQRWAAKTVKNIIGGDGFKGREVMTAIASDDVFIDQVKVPMSSSKQVEEAAFAKIREKLPFDSSGAMVKYIIGEQQSSAAEIDVLVMAADNKIVNRHLAMYEEAGLEIKGMGVWPMALANSYVKFFGRREVDIETVVMLIDVGTNHSNVVVCKHKNVLFARVVPIGFEHLGKGEMLDRFGAELGACCRYFESLPGYSRIQRIILFSCRSVDRNICEKVAELAHGMQIPAQIADVFAAVEIKFGSGLNVDRRGCKVDWATAFGLSLGEWQGN